MSVIMRVPSSHSLILVLAAALWCGGWASASAAEKVILHLQNGDKISGEILSENKERVVVRTPYQRKLSIPLSQVQKREAPAPPAPPPAAAPPPTPPSGAVTPKTPPPAAVTNVVQKPEGKPWYYMFLSNWHGTIDVGATMTYSTTDSSLYHVNFKATHTAWTNQLRNTIDVKGFYGRTEKVVTQNKIDGDLKTEFDVFRDKKFYLYNVGEVGFDRIQRIDLKWSEGPGLGYKLFDTTNILTSADQFKLNVEAGGQFQKIYYNNETTKETVSVRLGENLAWNFTNTKLLFTQKLQYSPSVEDPADFILRFQADVSYPIFKNLSLKLTVQDDYTSRPLNENIEKNNLIIRTSVGISF